MPVSHGLNHCLTVVGHMTNAIEVRANRISLILLLWRGINFVYFLKRINNKK